MARPRGEPRIGACGLGRRGVRPRERGGPAAEGARRGRGARPRPRRRRAARGGRPRDVLARGLGGRRRPRGRRRRAAGAARRGRRCPRRRARRRPPAVQPGRPRRRGGDRVRRVGPVAGGRRDEGRLLDAGAAGARAPGPVRARRARRGRAGRRARRARPVTPLRRPRPGRPRGRGAARRRRRPRRARRAALAHRLRPRGRVGHGVLRRADAGAGCGGLRPDPRDRRVPQRRGAGGARARRGAPARPRPQPQRPRPDPAGHADEQHRARRRGLHARGRRGRDLRRAAGGGPRGRDRRAAARGGVGHRPRAPGRRRGRRGHGRGRGPGAADGAVARDARLLHGDDDAPRVLRRDRARHPPLPPGPRQRPRRAARHPHRRAALRDPADDGLLPDRLDRPPQGRRVPGSPVRAAARGRRRLGLHGRRRRPRRRCTRPARDAARHPRAAPRVGRVPRPLRREPRAPPQPSDARGIRSRARPGGGRSGARRRSARAPRGARLRGRAAGDARALVPARAGGAARRRRRRPAALGDEPDPRVDGRRAQPPRVAARRRPRVAGRAAPAGRLHRRPSAHRVALPPPAPRADPRLRRRELRAVPRRGRPVAGRAVGAQGRAGVRARRGGERGPEPLGAALRGRRPRDRRRPRRRSPSTSPRRSWRASRPRCSASSSRRSKH